MTTKICYVCKIPKELKEFHKCKKKPHGVNSMCKECRKNYIRLHYSNNKKYYVEKAKNSREKLINWFKELKKTLECEICKENHPACLDFHHIDPNEKELEVSRLTRTSKPKLLKEIKKCKILCANCHRKFHHDLKGIVAEGP